jgi:hypothetical protein
MHGAIAWLADATGQQIVGSIISSSMVAAAVSYFVRSGSTPPSWEASWLIWTGSAFVGFLLSVWLLRYLPATPRFQAEIAEERSRQHVMEIGSKEWKRYALASYYMHALVCKNAIMNDGAASDGKLRELDQRLDMMRQELKASSDVLSHNTSLEFSHPNYTATNLRDRVLENAEHVMARAHHKWNAWGGNTAVRPLASGDASRSQVV